MEDAANGCLKDVYAPVDAFGLEKKPDLNAYPKVPWESMDLEQFNQVPRFLRPVLRKIHFESFHLFPIESGRGCPYGCEFCTVTGFFGDSIRFRSNESVVDEMLMLKARAVRRRRSNCRLFHRRQFRHQREAHQVTASDIIAAGAQIHWVARSAPTSCATRNSWT